MVSTGAAMLVALLVAAIVQFAVLAPHDQLRKGSYEDFDRARGPLAAQQNDGRPPSGFPGMQVPGFRIPSQRHPPITIPKMEFPGMEFPGLEIPAREFPGYDFPGMTFPKIDVPNMQFPTMNIPEIEDIPELEIPDVEINAKSSTTPNRQRGSRGPARVTSKGGDRKMEAEASDKVETKISAGNGTLKLSAKSKPAEGIAKGGKNEGGKATADAKIGKGNNNDDELVIRAKAPGQRFPFFSDFGDVFSRGFQSLRERFANSIESLRKVMSSPLTKNNTVVRKVMINGRPYKEVRTVFKQGDNDEGVVIQSSSFVEDNGNDTAAALSATNNTQVVQKMQDLLKHMLPEKPIRPKQSVHLGIDEKGIK